jgi:hypothetical protein
MSLADIINEKLPRLFPAEPRRTNGRLMIQNAAKLSRTAISICSVGASRASLPPSLSTSLTQLPSCNPLCPISGWTK